MRGDAAGGRLKTEAKWSRSQAIRSSHVSFKLIVSILSKTGESPKPELERRRRKKSLTHAQEHYMNIFENTFCQEGRRAAVCAGTTGTLYEQNTSRRAAVCAGPGRRCGFGQKGRCAKKHGLQNSLSIPDGGAAERRERPSRRIMTFHDTCETAAAAAPFPPLLSPASGFRRGILFSGGSIGPGRPARTLRSSRRGGRRFRRSAS